MRKSTVPCGLLLALLATAASASPGVNLRWSACFGDGGTFNRGFACNVNTGGHQLVGSFELGANLVNTSGNEIIVDLAADAPVLLAWWEVRFPGLCRSTSLSFNTAISPAAVNCFDWGQGLAVGGIGAYQIGIAGPNTARVKAVSAVPPSGLQTLFTGVEYFSFNLFINNVNTVGTTSCAGCETPVCIVFNSLNLTTPISANNRTLTGPTNGTDSNFCTWQGGGQPISGRGEGCPAATPTRLTTWGTVKSLYR